MYVWTVVFEEMWNFDGEWTEGTEWKVAAKTYDQALAKAEKLATSKSRSFTDSDDNLCYVVKVRPVRVERGDALDG